MKFWWGFHTFHFQNPTYSRVPTTLSLELHTTLFEEWQFCEGFFVKMYVNHIYIFFSLLYDIIRLCAQVLYFFDFFELVMLNPNQSKPLSKPLKTPHTTGSSIVVRGRLRSGARVSYSVHRSAWDALIGWISGVWISLSRWGIRTVHLNPTARVDAVHGPSLRSALSIVACVPVPTRSMHAHPQNCARALHACPRRSPAPPPLSTQ